MAVCLRGPLRLSRDSSAISHVQWRVWAPVAGQLIDRLGTRAAYAFGLASLGFAYLLAGFSTQLWHYMVTVGLLGGLGAASLGMIICLGAAEPLV